MAKILCRPGFRYSFSLTLLLYASWLSHGPSEHPLSSISHTAAAAAASAVAHPIISLRSCVFLIDFPFQRINIYKLVHTYNPLTRAHLKTQKQKPHTPYYTRPLPYTIQKLNEKYGNSTVNNLYRAQVQLVQYTCIRTNVGEQFSAEQTECSSPFAHIINM